MSNFFLESENFHNHYGNLVLKPKITQITALNRSICSKMWQAQIYHKANRHTGGNISFFLNLIKYTA